MFYLLELVLRLPAIITALVSLLYFADSRMCCCKVLLINCYFVFKSN